jgi:hypothetical protein
MRGFVILKNEPSQRRKVKIMPSKKPSRPREPDRDYSHRSLADKLGIKPGQRISVMGVESAEFLAELTARVPEYFRGKLAKDADQIFFSAESKQDLVRLQSLANSIQKSGAIWAVYPKGQQHIREIDVIAAAKSAGLVDNKVCAFSTTHTALRLCIPIAKR